jgi:hypothetical protein
MLVRNQGRGAFIRHKIVKRNEDLFCWLLKSGVAYAFRNPQLFDTNFKETSRGNVLFRCMRT